MRGSELIISLHSLYAGVLRTGVWNTVDTAKSVSIGIDCFGPAIDCIAFGTS